MVELGPRAKFVVFFLRCYRNPNFSQAFSHVGLVNTALNLHRGRSGPASRTAKPESSRRYW